MKRSRLRITDECLARWRDLPASSILRALTDHAKADPSFRPSTAKGTERWHARVGDREFELLLNGSRFFDTRTRQGGGGAVDLAMHLLDADFRRAVEALREASL